MENSINGLHHITALASDPQRNFDFYTQILGLRFVKKTVNFDAPDVYHFYFGDETGSPGTILTFFPFPNARRGSRGNGEAAIVSFAVPMGSLEFWQQWLKLKNVSFNGPHKKFGYDFISFQDTDGMGLELVETDVDKLTGWQTAEIPRQHSIRKFFGTTLWLASGEKTEELITKVMGFSIADERAPVKRYVSGTGHYQAFIDINADPQRPGAIQSAGSVHHIAWRTESDETQRNWIERLWQNGFSTTEVIDRNYFNSIYFREPGGVLFEIATDTPGFMVDEEKDSLGQQLKLPAKYESRRKEIEQVLLPLEQK